MMMAGVKVVEFSQNIAVPYCGRLLANMGADVIKVEPPGGDAMRKLAPVGPDEGKGYAVANGGKRSIVLDYAAPEAGETIDALLRWADVALVGLKLSDLGRYGLDWEHAKGVNPQLVYLIATAFGPQGPDAERGGYDVLAQARSGIGFIMNRTRGGVPMATRPAFIDVGTGITSALGVVTALRHRDLTGEGQRVDTSLLGTAIALGTPMLSSFERLDDPRVAELKEDIDALRLAGADFEAQRGVYEDRIQPAGGAFQLYFRPYATSDGMISIAGLSPALFKKFHAVTGLPAPDGAQPPSPEFAAIVNAAEDLFRTKTSAEWIGILQGAGFPVAPYNHPYEALDDEQVLANDYIVEAEHPVFGHYRVSGHPIRFEQGPTTAASRSPMLGEHNAEVRELLGLSSQQGQPARDS